MTRFSAIQARAEARKGGPESLAKLLPPPSKAALTALGDDRILAEESGPPYRLLSRICAMSTGTNYEPERLMQYIGGGEEA